jgi:ATP-dependent RNA helicase RhlE
MGFDASTIEAEKPEVRERPDVRNPRNARGPRGDGPNGGGGGGGRKDKGKDKGKEKPASNSRGERPAREQKPREGTPAREQQRPIPRAAADRAPDEFLDDDIDNFGNRVDYVPQQKPAQGRGRRPGAPAQGAGAPRSGQPQGRQNGPRNSNGSSTGTPPAKRNGPRNGAPRDGQARRDDTRPRRPARDDQPRQEPAVQNPRSNQPKIMHKESKADRFPTPEQLDQLPSRPRGEKPALLTRNR